MRRSLSCLVVLAVSAVSGVALSPPAGAAPGDVALASVTDTGVKGNRGSYGADLSADGSKVAFASLASNLDERDTDFTYDVYVKDRLTGDLTLVSTDGTGAKGDRDSSVPSISADGTKVAFQSTATNLDPADTDTGSDVYVKDLVTGEITVVSTSDTGGKGNGFSGEADLSADGTKVAFISLATNLDPADADAARDVYVKDLVTGDLTLASAADAGLKGDGSYQPSLSADGSAVAFYTYSRGLDPGDTDVWVADVYVRDLVTGGISLASANGAGTKGNQTSAHPSLSADGTKVAFQSYADNLDPADPTIGTDLYLKDLVNGDLTLISTNSAGTKSNQDSQVPTLSADGTRVAFNSNSTNLAPADTDSQLDTYVKDLVSGTLTLASTTATGTKANNSQNRITLSGDGTTVAFDTDSTNLDPGDGDATADIYAKELGAPDQDGDSTPDPLDNCPSTVNPGQADTDGDGVGDACDATPNGDSDGDGVDDGTDNCPDAPNPSQADTDGDGAGDACDATPNGDTDDDGVDDGTDNCPDAPNPSQADTDGDGSGDACDATPNGDTDSDGVDQAADNCPDVANPGQADADGDGAGDACDATPNGDGDGDGDGDGVPDAADNCPAAAEDLDGNQDADGCPENASHDVRVAAFTTWARTNLTNCGNPCTVPFTIRIVNRGTHRETSVPYAVTVQSGAGRSYSAACTGDAAARSRDGDLDPGETVVVRGCTASYTARGTFSHRLTVDHGTGSARYYDNNLANNTATSSTRVR